MSRLRDSLPALPVDIALANRIDEICDQFESEWNSGARPTLQTYLDDSIGPHTATLFLELVRIDIEQRALRGEVPRVHDYAALYPQYAEALSSLDVEGPCVATITLGAPAPERTHVGRYELREKIGEGGFGAVWKAWDAELARWVALKIPRDRLDGLDQEKAFLREARAAAELEHPHIVSVLAFGNAEGEAYIVSRLIEGVSLRQYLKARPFAPQDAARLCLKLARAVDYAHTKGVVHRDLKPSNILLDGGGEPHITDFGLSVRTMEDATAEPSGTLAGTPAYMSPEQVVGRPKPDHRSDVYSLGVTLYELLAGRVPFVGDQATVLHQVLHVEPDPPRQHTPAVPADLETICLKAMTKDREQRYQTASELADDLERFLAGEPIRARAVGRAEKAWRWCRRNPVVTTALSIAVFAGGIAMSLGFAPRRPEKPLPLPTPPASGERLVTLKTDPPGARVVFYRLDDRTGEPDPKQRTEAPTRSPVKLHLPPGDYFVVAALDPAPDGSVRFHEVYRHVPSWDEAFSFSTRNLSWRLVDRTSGLIEVTTITIPQTDIVAGMALIAGSREFAMRDGEPESLHRRRVRAYFVDALEASVQDVRRVTPSGQVTIDSRYVPVPDDWPATLNFNHAMHIAEKLGKRLPMEHEYEYAATSGGATRYPWGDTEVSAQDVAPSAGSIRLPFDATRTTPPLLGLCSGVAEWTTTYPHQTKANDTSPVSSESRNVRQRIVRGFLVKDTAGRTGPGDPRSKSIVHVNEIWPNLGFRCVRSHQPHLTISDFAD